MILPIDDARDAQDAGAARRTAVDLEIGALEVLVQRRDDVLVA